MQLSLLVQDTQMWGCILQSKFLESSWTTLQMYFLSFVKSPNIWACAITIQTGTRDGALNMFEDCFLIVENTQCEPFIFLPIKAKAGQPLKCIPHKTQAGSSYMWLRYDGQNHFILNCMLPRRVREANRTQEKCFLEEDGQMHHTTIAIVVASN